MYALQKLTKKKIKEAEHLPLTGHAALQFSKIIPSYWRHLISTHISSTGCPSD